MNDHKAIRRTLIIFYVTVFFVACLVRIYNGHWMSIQQPVLFADGLNITSWLFRLSGWLQLIHDHTWLAILLDILFFSANIFIPVIVGRKPDNLLVVSLLLFNFIYTSTSSAMGLHTIETQLSWIFMPLLFFQMSTRRWLVLFCFLRFFFLFYFFSSGLWKITRGSIFDLNQMQHILLQQHKDLLTLDPEWWLSRFFTGIIQKPFLAQGLYVLSCLLELLFLVGFFTFRYDKWLFIIYIIFIVADVLFMRILFGETLALAVLLLFSTPVKQLIDKCLGEAAITG
jgi:hypothetical protein